MQDRDWRWFLPQFDERGTLWMRNEELVGYATDEGLDELLAAVPNAAAERFWAELLGWEVARRLGDLDLVVYLPGPWIHLDATWRGRLARVAGAGLRGPSGYGEAELSLALTLTGWSRLGGGVTAVLAELSEALEDGRPWLVEVALTAIVALRPNCADLIPVTAGLLGSADPDRRRLGLRVVLAARALQSSLPRRQVAVAALDWLVDELGRLDARWVAQTICRDSSLDNLDPVAMLCHELGLGRALLDHNPDLIVPELPLLARGSEHAALAAMRALLGQGMRGRRRAAELASRFCEPPDWARVGSYVEMLDDRGLSSWGLAALLDLGPGLAPQLRARIVAQIAALEPWPWSPDQGFGAAPSEWMDDDDFVAVVLPKVLELAMLTKELRPLFAHSPRFWSALEAERPRLLLELERELAGPQSGPWARAGWMTALGQLRREPGDEPERRLLDAFSDPDEFANTRLSAARALSTRPLGLRTRERLLALAGDASAIVRAWVYRMLDDPLQWDRARRDPSAVVRLLAERR